MTRRMKDSGVEWIGEIPEEWEVTKLKYVTKDHYSGGTPLAGNEDFYGDKGHYFVNISDITKQRYLDQTEKKITKDGIRDKNLKIVPKKSILYAMYASVGKLSISKVDLYISQAVLSFVQTEKIDKYYLIYSLINIEDFTKYLSNGTTQMNLNAEIVKSFNILLPPKSQQKSIADFLDKKVLQIDNIISKTKKSIEEYKKYKQSLITETVTKGLDKNVAMKDSGVEWIGDIPEHWDVVKLRKLFKFGSGLTITKSDLRDEGIRVINYGEIHSKYKFDVDINRDKLKCVDKIYLDNRKSALVNKGDFIFCDTSEDREGSGNCVVVREHNDKLLFAGSHTVTARLRSRQDPIYIRYMLMASPIKEQISSTVVGIKVYSITQAILKTIVGVLPPLQEQKSIASYLDLKCNEIDKLVSSKEKLIIEMENYKKSLIYEVVTGKKEVY